MRLHRFTPLVFAAALLPGASSTLNINATVTISATVDIAWYGAANGVDDANRTVDGTGAGTALTANATSDRSWALGSLAQGGAAVSTAAGGDAALQFTIRNVGNCRVDYTARATASTSTVGTTWSAAAAAGSSAFVMDASTDAGTNWDNLTGSYADPNAAGSRWKDKAVSSLLKLDLRFTPPSSVDNAGESTTITVSVTAAAG